MLMDILVEVASRPGGSNKSILLLGPPGVGMMQFTARGSKTCMPLTVELPTFILSLSAYAESC